MLLSAALSIEEYQLGETLGQKFEKNAKNGVCRHFHGFSYFNFESDHIWARLISLYDQIKFCSNNTYRNIWQKLATIQMYVYIYKIYDIYGNIVWEILINTLKIIYYTSYPLFLISFIYVLNSHHIVLFFQLFKNRNR